MPSQRVQSRKFAGFLPPLLVCLGWRLECLRQRCRTHMGLLSPAAGLPGMVFLVPADLPGPLRDPNNCRSLILGLGVPLYDLLNDIIKSVPFFLCLLFV